SSSPLHRLDLRREHCTTGLTWLVTQLSSAAGARKVSRRAAFLAANNNLWNLAPGVVDHLALAVAALHSEVPTLAKPIDRRIEVDGNRRLCALRTNVADAPMAPVGPHETVMHRNPMNGFALCRRPPAPITLHALRIITRSKLFKSGWPGAEPRAVPERRRTGSAFNAQLALRVP